MDYVADRIVYVAGLSKAYASHAAFITCFDDEMRRKLELASTYIFSGPVPTATLASGLAGLEVNEREGDTLRDEVYRLSGRLVNGARALGFEVDNSHSFPIVFVVTGDMGKTLAAVRSAESAGILFTPGVFPAVPLSRGGLRFTVTALNTDEEIDTALEALRKIKQEQGVKP